MSSLGSSNDASQGVRSSLRSSSLLSRFSSFGSHAGGQEGIPEALNEGASTSSGSSAAASDHGRGSSPVDGVATPSGVSQASSADGDRTPQEAARVAVPPALPVPCGSGLSAEQDSPEADRAHGEEIGSSPLGSNTANGHHAGSGVPNGLPNGAHASAHAARPPGSAAWEASTANGHHSAQSAVPHAPIGAGPAEPEQAAAGALQNGALASSSQWSEQTLEAVAHSSSISAGSASPSDTIRAALRAGLRVDVNGTANGHGAGQRSSHEARAEEAAAPEPGKAAQLADGTAAGDPAAVAGTAGHDRRSASLPDAPHIPNSPTVGGASGGEAAAKQEGRCGGGGGNGQGAQGPGRSRSPGSAERGILRKSVALPVQREAVKGYLIHRSAAFWTATLDLTQEVLQSVRQ